MEAAVEVDDAERVIDLAHVSRPAGDHDDVRERSDRERHRDTVEPANLRQGTGGGPCGPSRDGDQVGRTDPSPPDQPSTCPRLHSAVLSRSAVRALQGEGLSALVDSQIHHAV